MNHIEAVAPGPLDNPVWTALTTLQAPLGHRQEFAARYHPDIAPFAGVASSTTDAWHSLGQLVAAHGPLLLLAQAPLPALAQLQAERLFAVCQMVDVGAPGDVSEEGVVRLTAADAEAMQQLTHRTQPGPFGTRTHEMGGYIGLREGSRLVAMAGERMRCAGFAEISAVCVDESHRGQGIAARLMNTLRRNMRQRGETPFLHVRDDNTTAIALYERLGFEMRTLFQLYRIAGRAAG